MKEQDNLEGKFPIYKILIFLFLFLSFSGKGFSQADSLDKIKQIYLIEFLNSDSEKTEVNDINILYLDSNSITYEDAVFNNLKNSWSPKILSVKYEGIKTFGYKVGTNIGARISRGALAGFSLGFIVGFLGGKFNPVGDGSSKSTFGDRMSTGSLFGIALAIPGALIGAITGIGSKEYEVLDISKYDDAKKYEIIKRLMAKGLKVNN